MALVNYAESDFSGSDSEDELVGEANFPKTADNSKTSSNFSDTVEEEYKMRIPKNAKPLLEPLNISRKSALNGKVILTIPTTEELDSSDESDSDQPQASKKPVQKPGSGSGAKGLLDVLPPPRALIVREGDKPIMPSMIPQQVKRLVKNKPVEKPAIVDDEQWDVEDEGDVSGGFFSFYDAKEDAEKAAADVEAVRRQTQKTLVEASSRHQPIPASAGPPEEATHECPPPQVVKPFKDSELPKPPGLYGDEIDEDVESVFTEETFIPGPERKRARWGASVAEVLASGAVKEVRQEDLTAGAKLELIKNVTTGAGRPKPQHLVDNPGKLAFRKHQITWLAYKAQEQEYELQEQWAEARRNQAQSRQKYGF
uniref:RRP7 domain-containing protein n=1 Tax=Mesocestoides corti TaxID=53468 RepID=A0A5K3FI40_MESCO